MDYSRDMGRETGRDPIFYLPWPRNSGNLGERMTEDREQTMGVLGSAGGNKSCRDPVGSLVCPPLAKGQSWKNFFTLD